MMCLTGADMNKWLLLVFLTLGMHGMYQHTDLLVTEVQHGMVTMEGEDKTYTIEEHEAWRIGDRAEAIVQNDKIIEVRWKK